MRFTLRVWRQKDAKSPGQFETYEVDGVPADASFLEMLDILNEKLIKEGKEPVAFDHDCREGICGSCGLFINGRAHGPLPNITTCRLYMRHFKDGDTITIEPFRARPFPVIKDLVVDRSALDRIIQKGGYISVNTGSAPDANSIPIAKAAADRAFDYATCIGCGACVAACKNASAMLFTSAKVAHLALLPQGQPERRERVKRMVAQMDAEGFGHCSNTGACAVECPAKIPLSAIARLQRDFIWANLTPDPYAR
ncbi:MAG: succinate dehydrogenase/fumarate reductase iron-sulfur subunit [Bacteroidia bacterium]|nr:succinate dehydrogenase/fumarate reductase iron-sulfur subunit [Bacteroidia bacterium]MDW8235120.1 succinate dehydrogenase/fumarate reductase iron-sulfur subunit [Bacteroidia bacterium]